MLKRGVMLENPLTVSLGLFFFNVPDRFSEETGTVAKRVNSSWVQFSLPSLKLLTNIISY